MKNIWIPYLMLLAGFVSTAQETDVPKDSLSERSTSVAVVKIQSFDSIRDEPKSVARFTYTKDSIHYEEWMGIEWRGNSALRYPKKSYDLELRVDSVSEVSKDLQFGDLRKDDDWILNSMYNEPLKLRSYFSNKLWLDISRSRVSDSLQKGKAGIDTEYVEVLLDDDYQGLYLLSEQVDRKLLQLKKLKNDTVHGELFKAGSYDEATSFQGAKPFNNAFPHWAGFEMEYPYENYEAHWERLYDFVDLVVRADEKTFADRIETQLDLNNAIDYYLFINLLRGTDNMGKNYFLARKDADQPYYFVPWDLDGVLGTIMDGKRIPTTNDIISNGLFDRLLAENPANYRQRMKDRWIALRTSKFDLDTLTGTIRGIYDRLDSEELYQKDESAWPMTVSKDDDLEYVLDWLERRVEFLDGFFEGM